MISCLLGRHFNQLSHGANWSKRHLLTFLKIPRRIDRLAAVSNRLDFPWSAFPLTNPSPLCNLTLIFNFKVNQNTFLENAKYEFLYVSNDERSSIVNDKKDFEQ